MKINSIDLKHYKPFKFSHIKKLHIDFVSPVTVLVGTNGSGKTTLFRMINPLPPVRTVFDKYGYKELNITHNGKDYCLTTDFSNKTSPHSFVVDDKELNIGGTSTLQEELIEKYLGYTKLDEKLFTCSIDFCKLGKTERKNLFFTLHPVDLSLLLQIHKKTVSKIKECSNTLSHLYTRKEEIETKLLSEEIVNTSKKHKEELENKCLQIDQAIYGINAHIDYINNICELDDYAPYPNEENFKQFEKDISKYRSKYHLIKNVNRETYLIDFNNLNVNRHVCENDINSIKDKITTINKEIQEYTLHLQSTSSKPISVMEEEIKALNNTISNLKFTILNSNTPFIISETELDNFYIFINDVLSPLCLFLSNKCSMDKLWNNQLLISMENKIKSVIQQIKYHNQNIEQLMIDQNTYKTEIQNKFDHYVPNACTFNDCGLKQLYLEKKNKLDMHITKLEEKLVIENSNKKHYERIYHTLYSMYESHKPYTDVYQEIMNHLSNHYQLVNLREINDIPLFKWMQKDPLMLIRWLTSLHEELKRYYYKKELMDKRQLLQQELDSLIKSNATSKEFLVHLIEEKTKVLNELLIALDTCINKSKNYDYELDIHQLFIDIKNHIESNEKLYENMCKAYIGRKAIEYYLSIKTKCEDYKRDIMDQLRDIDTLIKEQDNLYARYNEEIIKHVKLLEIKKLKYQAIEQELSPNKGIPHKYLIDFLNVIINNTNYFISQVFSYPLQLQTIPSNKPIDFTLSIEVGDVVIDDISTLSKGQMEIVNLSMTLAILHQRKKLENYPLFLDEIGASLDPTHQLALLELLKSLMDQKLCNQMFMINHQAIYFDGFNNADLIALKTDDTVLTNRINEYVEIV